MLLSVLSTMLCLTACFEEDEANWDLTVSSVSVGPGSFLPGQEKVYLKILFVNNSSETSPSLAGTITTASEFVTIEDGIITAIDGGSPRVGELDPGESRVLMTSEVIFIKPNAPIGENVIFEIKFVEHPAFSSDAPDMTGSPSWTGRFSLTLEKSGWDIEIESVVVSDYSGSHNTNGILNPGEQNIPLDITLRNIGTESVSLIGFLSTESDYVNIAHKGSGHYTWVSIGSDKTWTNDSAEVSVDLDTPVGTSILFTLDLLESTGYTQDPNTTPAWSGSFSLAIE